MERTDLRTNAARIIDQECKARVLRGIELLDEHMPDWVDRIDPSALTLSSASSCVLGQVFEHEKPTEEMVRALNESESACSISLDDLDEGYVDGYEKGLAILDGPLLDKKDAPIHYGFLTYNENGDPSYRDLTIAWLIALGADEVVEERFFSSSKVPIGNG